MGLVDNLERVKKQQSGVMEEELRRNPTNFDLALEVARTYAQLQQPERCFEVLDGVLNNAQVDAKTVLRVADAYVKMGSLPKVEAALDKLTRLEPASPEAWYDFAAVQATMGKNKEATTTLARALDLSAKRLKQEPKALDLLASVRKDDRFNSLRSTPEFQKLVPPK
jgi:thioredoxin-like negative regulator of GroEL